MPRIVANTVKGLLLGIDRRKVEVPQVVSGKNFFVDIDGPRSGFSRVELAHNTFYRPKFLQAIEIDTATSSWIFTTQEVLEPDYAQARWKPKFTYPTITGEFPWTYARVGGKYYFTTRGAGLLEFDPNTNSVEVVTGGGLPSGVVSCCESGGRLIVLADGVVAWSAIDDGRNFTPSTSTGAGFQSLAIIGATSANSAYGVYKIPNGFMTFTANGIMRSLLIRSINPFRHDELGFEHVPLNSHCIIRMKDNSIIFLSEQGFFRTNGKAPEIWEPLMSEHFRLTVLPAMKDKSDGTVKLTYAGSREWLFVSYSTSGEKSVYNKAFVYSARAGEWGSFDRVHTAISEIRLLAGAYTGINVGFVDTEGSAYLFDFNTADSLYPELELWDYPYLGKVQYDARNEYGVIKFPTVGYWLTEDESSYQTPGTVYIRHSEVENVDSPDSATMEAGVAESNATQVGSSITFPTNALLGAGLVLYQLAIKQNDSQGLNASVEVGLFRLPINQSVAEYSYVTDVMIGMLAATTIGVVFEDWLSDYETDIFEDWPTISPDEFEDWGGGTASQSVYTATVKSSLDGYKAAETTPLELVERLSDGKTVIYSTYANGVYHAVNIAADEPGESFHLKSLELTINPAGQVM